MGEIRSEGAGKVNKGPFSPAPKKFRFGTLMEGGGTDSMGWVWGYSEVATYSDDVRIKKDREVSPSLPKC